LFQIKRIFLRSLGFPICFMFAHQISSTMW
jgi:hypothetical protein